MNLKSKIKFVIKKPNKLFRILGERQFFNWIPDREYLKILYFLETGKKLNIDDPKTYNEKLQWIKLYYRDPKFPMYVDKYDVRKYVAEKIGDQYLIPLINVYKDVSEIQWDMLPDKFVLKCTHGSGSNIVCIDKSKLNIEGSINILNKWMNKNWYWFGREWAYKNIVPRITCEKFIGSSDNDLPTDFKFMCFNGEPKFIQVHHECFAKGKVAKDFYDLSWNKLNIRQGAPNSGFVTKKPENFDLMLDLARKLAHKIPFCRIDFYEKDGSVYFGEITLYPTSGLKPFDREEDDMYFGNLIDLPNKILQN